VSHTTEDLVFDWDPVTPLVVDSIELPQLQLVRNRTADCTQVYSTGLLFQFFYTFLTVNLVLSLIRCHLIGKLQEISLVLK